jgi:hypothetical protein
MWFSSSDEGDDMNMRALLSGLLLLVLCSGAARAAAALEKHHLSSSLQCLDRRIELQADCFKSHKDDSRLQCTSQRLDFFDVATGKKLNSVVYPPAMETGLANSGLIEHKLQYIRCGQTPEHEKYVEVVTSNGQRCDDCERLEVFSWDGVSQGIHNPKGGNSRLVEAATKDGRESTIRSSFLLGFYSHQSVRCDGEDAGSDEKNMRAWENEINKNVQVAFGMPGEEPDPAQTIDPTAMANITGLLACAATLKESECFAFELFTGSPKTSALYRQFADAIGQLPAGPHKVAAQRCLNAPAKRG